MQKERDAQRKKLYAAERVLKPISARLESVKEIEAYLAQTIARAPIQRRYGRVLARAVEVGDGRGRRKGGADADGVYMPKWCRTQCYVLHELAHTIAIRRYGAHIAGHGWQFCAVYLDLVRFMMGKEAHDLLMASFKAGGVRWRAKRVVVA